MQNQDWKVARPEVRHWNFFAGSRERVKLKELLPALVTKNIA
jgi:hypothetical protein